MFDEPTARAEFVGVEPGVDIFCRLGGLDKEGVPVVFLHGNRDNHSHYTELESIVARYRPTVCIDFRGHGLSSKPDRVMTPDLLAADLDIVIRALRFDKVILLGHSLGSVVSMVYAWKWPERVERMILMAPAAHFEIGFTRPDPPESPDDYQRFVTEANRRAAPLFFQSDYPEVALRAIAVWSQVPYHVNKNLLRLKHPDLRPVVPGFPMPILLIAGERDRATTVEDARWIESNAPHAELFIVDEAAHFMHNERLDLVAPRILRFLATDSRAVRALHTLNQGSEAA
jgi:pimeloyl-ACP methyl ester carboxylesterase